MKRVGVLGCTGSIGKTALNVIKNDPDLQAVLLVNNSDIEGLKKQIAFFKPEIAICLKKNYLYNNGKEYTIFDNPLENTDIYQNCDIVVNGIVGLAGLQPTLSVIKSGKKLATANKESFVCAGSIIEQYKKKYDGVIYPVDSEHSAVWQLIDGKKDFAKIIITASGGAFRDKSKVELLQCKAEDALKHPNWVMGKKVTIDCATLMNKGMEIIEAKYFFGQKPEVLGHRESFVHALVEYSDGTYNANISKPDMAIPISYALHYPFVKPTNESLNLIGKGLNFFELNEDNFPCLKIAKVVADMGDIAGCVMNSADEILVERYLRNDIGFYDIPLGVEKALEKFATNGNFGNKNDVYSMDKAVREYTLSMSFMR